MKAAVNAPANLEARAGVKDAISARANVHADTRAKDAISARANVHADTRAKDAITANADVARAGTDTRANPDVKKANPDAAISSGQPLPESVRAFFEPRLSHDLSQVRIHTDTRAAECAGAINARAFTLGRDVVFASGQYAPATNEGRRLLGHELAHVLQQERAPGPTLQCWRLKSSDACLVDAVARASTLLTGKIKDAESAYGRWGCKTDEFISGGKGPELEIKYGGTACAFSWKNVTDEDLISINPGLIDCCKDCPDRAQVIELIARTILHETAHWCAAKHGKNGAEHGDELEKTLFGGVPVLEDCVFKIASDYGDKPCFTCPYVVKKGDSLWKIADKLYAHGEKWRIIYNANREKIGDNPNLIHPGLRLIIPPMKVPR